MWTIALVVVTGCTNRASSPRGRLLVGVVAYGEEQQSLNRYDRFLTYLGESTQAIIELEPAHNELKAIERIESQTWSLAFAPPGLAAIAIAKAQYQPLFPLQGANTERAAIVVAQESAYQTLAELNGATVAFGQPGSATGYYLPLYDLYGLTLAEARFAPTPKTVLDWIASGEVDAGALSKAEFDRFRLDVTAAPLRVVHTSRNLPTGVVLVGPTVDRRQQELLRDVMNAAPPAIATEAGYVPNADVPDYRFFIEIVDKVKPIESQIRDRPARLFASP
ncbi:MAG: phosphate/phosphite/phosphonate ABC transporter substrate-binding protein [Cyanobacteria bacterium J06642_2]